MEKYLSFTIKKLKFINSFQFAVKSLESPVKTLKDEEIQYTSTHIKNQIYSTLFVEKVSSITII